MATQTRPDSAQGNCPEGCCHAPSQRRQAQPVGQEGRRDPREGRAEDLPGCPVQAERAVLVPVGAALTARDAVVEAVKPYIAGRESAEKELRRSASACRRTSRGSSAAARPRATARCARSSAPAPVWSASCASAQLGRAHGEAEPPRGRAPGQVDAPPVRAQVKSRAARCRARPTASCSGFVARLTRRLISPRSPERAAGERLPASYSPAVCSISPPSPAPSLRGRRWPLGFA